MLSIFKVYYYELLVLPFAASDLYVNPDHLCCCCYCIYTECGDCSLRFNVVLYCSLNLVLVRNVTCSKNV